MKTKEVTRFYCPQPSTVETRFNKLELYDYFMMYNGPISQKMGNKTYRVLGSDEIKTTCDCTVRHFLHVQITVEK